MENEVVTGEGGSEVFEAVSGVEENSEQLESVVSDVVALDAAAASVVAPDVIASTNDEAVRDETMSDEAMVEDVIVEEVAVEVGDAVILDEQAVVVAESELALDPGVVALVEALILAYGEPLGVEQMSAASGLDVSEIERAVAAIKDKFSGDSFGFELVAVAEKWQFRTKAQFGRFMAELKADKPRRLSSAALETLAIVAYRQPIVRSDIEKIRGVDVTPTVKTLLERSLIRIVGHQSTVGQPALYGTTEEFLKLFGLNSLGELPTLKDLNDLAKDPGETITKGELEIDSEVVSGHEVEVGTVLSASVPEVEAVAQAAVP